MSVWTAMRTWLANDELTVARIQAIADNITVSVPVGSYMYFCAAPTTVETTLNDGWLEANGVSVLRADYPDLNTLLSGLSYPFGTVDGTHMTLPDLRGRAPWGAGTHTNAGLGDSDGVAVASRQPKHSHTNSLSAGSHTHSFSGSGTTSTDGDHSHTGNWGGVSASGAGTPPGSSSASTSTAGSHNHSVTISGTTGSGGGSLSGSVGSGMSGSDAVAHLVAGTYYIKAVA